MWLDRLSAVSGTIQAAIYIIVGACRRRDRPYIKYVVEASASDRRLILFSHVDVKKIIFLIPFLLCGCQSFLKNPTEIPKDTRVSCTANLCCYPIDKDNNRMVCVSGDAFRSMIVYFKVIEK